MATDQAKNVREPRVSFGVEPPRYEDSETTIEQLKTRHRSQTIGIIAIETLDPVRIDASENR